MQRFLLVHEGQRILLPDGETLLGRGLDCRIRFNDPAVSRRHLRIDIDRGRATVVNLSSNGTLINGVRLDEPHQLADGDELSIGFRRIRVEIVVEQEARSAADELRHQAEAQAIAEESTRPGEDGWRQRRELHEEEARKHGLRRELTPRTLEAIQIHTCPRCRNRVSFFDDICPDCGYAWPPGHPSRHTQKITIEKVTPRKDARYSIEVPVIYASSTLTLDAIARDISRGGMFIETELLDPVGTPCELTALPDGHSALQLTGVVAHVTDDLTRATMGTVSGLGIRLIGGTPEALRWLEGLLARYESAIVE